MDTFAVIFRRSWLQVWHTPRAWWLIVAYAVLNGLDIATTYADLRLGGVEASPLYAPLFATSPFTVGALVKLVTAAIALLCAISLYSVSRRASLVLLTLCTVVLAAVVLSNALHLL